MENTLYYGDNLDVLRECIPDESVDLIYLDPPFNSKASYNVLFRTPEGEAAEAQAEAFQDTWTWGYVAESAYSDVLASRSSAAGILSAMRSFLGESDMMAYLAMMSVRLIELHRVLKNPGTIYLHCDPTASHYLKILLDGIFGANQFLNEIIWKRTNARGTAGKWPRVHDVLLCYTKGADFTFNQQKAKADKAKLPHTLITGPDGKKYQTYELTGAGTTKVGESGTPWRGFSPTKMGRHWGNSHSVMDKWDNDRLIHWPKNGGFPRRRAAEPFDPEQRKVTVGDVWNDIDRLNQTAKERLGYPTQKPLALLERIIKASSNKGDIVLDPFCGCGTTVHAALELGRRWIGIDVTHYAVTVIESRLKEHFPKMDEVPVWGRPRDLEGARDLARRDKYQFQWWANWLVGVQNYREHKKGADKGIDGTIFFRNGPWGTGRVLVSVKAGENLGVSMVRDLRGTLEREGAELGLLVSLTEPTAPMVKEAAAAGLVQTAHGPFHCIQLMTVEELFLARPNLPPAYQVQPEEGSMRRKAKRPKDEAQMAFTFTIPGTGKQPSEVVYADPRLGLGVARR